MKYFFITSFLFCLCQYTMAQFDNNGFSEFRIDQISGQKKQTTTTTKKSNPIYVASDSLFVLVENGQKYIIHTVQKGQTVYSLKKFYGIDFSDIYYSNPNLEVKGMKIGQQVRIPIVDQAIKFFQNSNFVDSAYVPIFYKVKASETLFRVSKIHFKIPVSLVKARNGLVSDGLSTGQILHIGWLDKRGLPDTLTKYTGLPAALEADNRIHQYRYEAKLANGMKEQSMAGIACWDKSMKLSATNKLYVMSSLAPTGSVVRVENSMTNRFLYAKVVAPKPDNSFTQNAIIMLTPTVANALGGLDSKFYVKVLYCE